MAHLDLAGVNTEVAEAERALLDTAIKFERKKIEELKVQSRKVFFLWRGRDTGGGSSRWGVFAHG